MASTVSIAKIAFNHWEDHSSKVQKSIESAVQQFLRHVHPTYHITRTTPTKCDLLGFAEAGHAVKIPERDGGHDATRFYKAPKLREEQGLATLEDDVRFGAWRYAWDGVDFYVYESSYLDFFERPKNQLYVLAPDATQARDGYHPATDKLLLAAGEWTKTPFEEISVFDDMQWKKDKELYTSVQGASWDDVILEPDVKAGLLRDLESFFDSRATYRAMNVPWKRGIILWGEPGNGKTISLKAMINSLAAREPPVPALYVKSLDSCSGRKRALQSIFSQARVTAPCLLIFDDLDSLVDDKTRSYFLNEVDGLESNDGILMIGSTNHLGELDPAITKRPSRFDRKYHFKMPDENARLAYCRYWKEKFAGSSTFDFPDAICPLVAKMTDGFSFAYMKELFITVLLCLAHGSEGQVGQSVPSSDSGSMSDAVVVDISAASEENTENTENAGNTQNAVNAESTENTEKQDKKQGEKQDKKQQRKMPEVETPKELEDNLLWQVLKVETKALWEQMSNEEAIALEKKKAAASCDPNPFPFNLPVTKAEQ